ncbi:hypothetical protein [Limnofasciculus baicalensis]|uniref:Uncharacterized protein n=1 Tax=Limnofasciculus baicalensis BBK-W-15 TaxID=2699891 RepID=A0AAE3KQ21_9CYAN|nr:hypothetical protein [Limnofasciculus baicalensis]MCP2731431.1 hypothetical protein [Limnofasciculus baicalensis BBK-W-15]
MVVLDLQAVTTLWHTISYLPELNSQVSLDWLVLAQNVTDPDVLGQMQRAFSNFINSGQVWALLIGLVVGYMFRGMSSY